MDVSPEVLLVAVGYDVQKLSLGRWCSSRGLVFRMKLDFEFLNDTAGNSQEDLA